MHESLLMWIVFVAIVLGLLTLDLGLFHKDDREISVKESLAMSGFYILISLLFSIWIWYSLGSQAFAEYLTGFLVEKSLSIDNIFIISLIFSSLSIPLKYQHRVLFWGILGVLIMRGAMIAMGAELVAHYNWILYIFAVFLIFTGIKMLFVPEHKLDINDNLLLKWMRKHLRITDTFHGHKFFVVLNDIITNKRKLFVTPLLIALVLVEFTDLIFALDSIPAIFTITKDPYIVYTSNIFAVLGLRALYFALATIIGRFHYLKYALALVLIFIGSKMFIADFLGLEKFPASISLGITLLLLAWGCLYSLYKSRKETSTR